jgi:hypothetical protein
MWENGTLKEATIAANKGGKIDLIYGRKVINNEFGVGEILKLTVTDFN